MIDDDEEDFIIVRDLLADINRDEYTLCWAPNYTEGLKLIQEKRHDIFLVDYRLGPDDGLSLVRYAIQNGSNQPFILFTGQNDIEIDKQALQAGASDYLVKGNITSSQLERSIRYSIEQVKNINVIKQLNIDLERKVIDRTLILEEAIAELEATKSNLAASLIKEKELNELKSRFVSMASHEFRTPLATILSSLALVKKYGELNEVEKQEKHISRIQSSIKNLTELLNDFLSIGKLEEGKVIICTEKFNGKELISEIIFEMHPLVTNNQRINYFHYGDEVVLLDKKILKNILLNLISNAIKFSPEGKNIEVNSSINSSIFTVSVKDEGIGIPLEDQKHLFERFFRGKNTEAIQGTGLGLNIVAKYVELMAGTINFTSQESKGTTFTVSFPQSRA